MVNARWTSCWRQLPVNLSEGEAHVFDSHPRATSLLLALLSNIGAAHTDEALDRQKSPNGGIVRMAGAYHLELSLQDGMARVYVTDHAGKPVATQHSSATLTLLGERKSSLTLRPANGNVLQAAHHQLAKNSMVKTAVVSVNLDGKSAEQARYSNVPVR